jgi:hypothetical protein
MLGGIAGIAGIAGPKWNGGEGMVKDGTRTRNAETQRDGGSDLAKLGS